VVQFQNLANDYHNVLLNTQVYSTNFVYIQQITINYFTQKEEEENYKHVYLQKIVILIKHRVVGWWWG